jgi:protein tyrosine/serine phosphatase
MRMPFILVSPGIYRSAKPRLKDLMEHQPELRTVINLSSGAYKWSPPDLAEDAEEAAFPIEQKLHIPMSPFSPPSEQDVKRVCDTAIASYNQPVLIHCLQGVDRTGVVVAYLRVAYHGWTADAALAEMRSHGFHSGRYFYWMPAIRRMLYRAEAEYRSRTA